MALIKGSHVKDDTVTDIKLIERYLRQNGTVGLTGAIRLSGDGIAWDDLRSPATGLKVPGISDPTYDTDNIGYEFSHVASNVAHFITQLSHRYKQESNIYPHVHWSPTTTDTGNVRWVMSYKWTNIDAIDAGSFTDIEIITAADGTAYKHQKASFPAITGTGKNISSLLVIKLSRTGGAGGDTYGAAALLREMDIHFQIDSFGSFYENDIKNEV